MHAEARRGPEGKARGVDGLIALHVGILTSAMVGLAEGHAGNAASDQA